mgnify:CR=1 FL=1
MTLDSIFLSCLYLAALGYFLCILIPRGKQAVAETVFIAAFSFHTVSLVSRGWMAGLFTPGAMLQEMFFLPWCMAFLLLVLRLGKNPADMVFRGAAPLCLFTVFALFYPKVPAHYLMTRTIFSQMFFLAEVMAHALFLLGGWFALLSLAGKSDEKTCHSLVVWGFVSYSAAQVFGAYWSYLGWGNLFSWTGRHLTSAAIWCFYAAYIHLRFLTWWNPSRRSVFAVAGAAVFFLMHYLSYFSEMSFRSLGL